MIKNGITMRRLVKSLGLFGCLVLAGCGKTAGEDAVSVNASKAPPVSSETAVGTIAASSEAAVFEAETAAWDPDVIQHQILADEGAMCGVIFLGYLDESVGDLMDNREYYWSIFESAGYLEEFPFLEEIPESNYVESEYGQELYCIIPEDPGATVSVNQWITDPDKGFEGKTGEVLYRSEEGTPILVRCNVSELVSDVEIVIVDSDGDVMRWHPSLSGMDGSVFVEAAEGLVYDFTFYNIDFAVNPLAVKVGHNRESFWDRNHETMLARMKYPVVKIGNDEEQMHPELAKNLSENMKTRKIKLYSEYEDKVQAAKEEYPGMFDYFTEYEVSESAMVRRADSRVLSILYSGYQYDGGLHGYNYYWGENYDTETGEVLKLEDVVNDISTFSACVKKQLETHWESENFHENFNLEQYMKENLEQIGWTLDYNGITVYFNPYEIAPYANVVYNATVAFDGNSELFVEKYQEVPDFYGIQLDTDTPFFYDVDADGELDQLLVYALPANEYYVAHNVHIDQECFVELDENEIYAYAIQSPHLVHMEDGKNYLLIENQTDNDYRTNTIYELTSGSPVKVDHILAGMHMTWVDEEDAAVEDVLTDPYYFRMDCRTWCVGTYDGYMTYYLDSDGFPLSYEDYYTFEIMPEFKVQKNFKLNLVNEYGEIGEAVTVKAGETVKYYRTDSSMFADFILPDGRIGRADLEWFEGLCSIDGNAAEELFDGIVFAG